MAVNLFDRALDAIVPGRRLRHVAALVFDTPLLLEPRKARQIALVVAARMRGTAVPDLGPIERQPSRRDRRDLVTEGGIALIDMTGLLVHRPGQMDADSTPLLSYEQLGLELAQAVQSPDVRGILLRVDSEGGETSGAFDLADQVFAARQRKPVWAVVADLGASAGYLIASAATRVIATQSATLGSIGVVFNRFDVTKSLEAEGVQVIQIAQGARKLDGSPVQPWREGSDEDTALRGYVQRFYGLFVDAVARYRGMTTEAVRATDAGVYVGADAVSIRLADEVASLDSSIARLATDISRPPAFPVPAIHQGGHMQPQDLAAALAAERQRTLAVLEVAGLVPGDRLKAAIVDGQTPEQLGAALHRVNRATDIEQRQQRLAALNGDEAALQPPTPLLAGAERGANEPPPLEVAYAARAFQQAQSELGHQIHISDAVAHVRRAMGLRTLWSTADVDRAHGVP
jgi:signal peptide peptidase SppA